VTRIEALSIVSIWKRVNGETEFLVAVDVANAGKLGRGRHGPVDSELRVSWSAAMNPS
jgi:hypothetical protein